MGTAWGVAVRLPRLSTFAKRNIADATKGWKRGGLSKEEIGAVVTGEH